jgi:hypothetical protein
MMGRQEVGQAPLFYSFNLEDHVPATHLLRGIDRFLDLSEGMVGGEGFATDASVIKADANRQRGVPGAEAQWSEESALTRPVREYLAALDAAEEERKPPKNISLTDPASQWTAAPGGPAFYAYSTNYLIDVQAGIIMDVEASAIPPTAPQRCWAGCSTRSSSSLTYRSGTRPDATSVAPAAAFGLVMAIAPSTA